VVIEFASVQPPSRRMTAGYQAALKVFNNAGERDFRMSRAWSRGASRPESRFRGIKVRSARRLCRRSDAVSLCPRRDAAHFFTKATIFQISRRHALVAKPGMPVILMPF